MIHPDFPYPLYLVISEQNCIHFHWLEVAQQALNAGVKVIQLREKNLTTHHYIQRAKQLKELTDRYNAKLIINDSLKVAIEVQAWGIHVGQTDISPRQISDHKDAPSCIGWSLEDELQLSQHDLQFVHYLGVSPIFSTPTKTDTQTEWGIEGLKKIRSLTSLPLIAIGGIHNDKVQQIVRAGANSIAVVSAICTSKNPYLSTLQLINKLYGSI